jgi:galactokinase
MTGAALAAALIDRGLDQTEYQAKASLFDLVLPRLATLPVAHASDSSRAQGSDVHAWWVPGRLEVFGTHTDYAGGRVLVCATPRGFAVVARHRSDRVVRVADARREQEVELIPGEEILRGDPPPEFGWRRYVAVVARRLARNFPNASLGTDIVIASDLPRAAGMSSSSALVVAVATVLVHAGALKGRDEWRQNIRGIEDEAGYYACMENGLSFGTLAGDGGVGTHGGSEDHAAILTATARHLSAFSFVPMRPLAVVPLPDAWRFVLAPSGVTAQKAGTAREAYNRLSAGTRVLLDLWNRQADHRAASLQAALVDRVPDTGGRQRGGVDVLRDLIGRSDVEGWPQDALGRRLDHFIREDARVPEALEAVRRGDKEMLRRLSADSQAEAEMLLGNQIPQTIALAAKARALGAFAARSFGAGFGGSVWALVERDRAEEFARRWTPDAFVAGPGPPLMTLA